MNNQKIARELVAIARELTAAPDPFKGLRLPRDLTKMSRGQQKKVVDQLVELGLRKLRRRQDIVQSQIPIAYEKRDDLALGNLQTMDNLLMWAVDKVAFGKKARALVGGKKEYYVQDMGRRRYTVNFHDGKSTHKDGSEFYDMRIFHSKKKMNDFIQELHRKGYKPGKSPLYK